jgi:hypothetical protein
MTESNWKIRRLGYTSASTNGQTLDGQLARLRADSRAGNCREEASGVQPIQAEVAADSESQCPLVKWATVARIDWLARSTFDLFAIVERIVDAGRAIFLTGRAWADTSILTYGGRPRIRL